MKLLALNLIFISSSALAGTNGYDLKLNLSVNGSNVSSPRLIVKAGELATISQKTESNETFIEVIANEGEVQKNKGILMKFTVGYIEKNGVRTVVSNPQILANENETATIEVGQKGKPSLLLLVVAKRTTI